MTYLQNLKNSTLILSNTKGLSVFEARMKTPSLMEISRCIGEAECHSLITKTLEEMNILIGNQIEKNDLAIYAYHIKESFPDLKMSEFIITLKNGIEGKYGKLYGKLNYITINEWLNESWNQFLNEADEEHKKRKSEKIIIHPDLLPAFEEFKNKFDEKIEFKKIEVKPDKKLERLKTEAEKVMQSWFDEFDKINKEQDGIFNEPNLRMVNVKGKTVDVNGFINLKFQEDAE